MTTFLTAFTDRFRTGGANPALKPSSANWSYDPIGTSGATVSEETALSLPTFYAGLTLIASTIAGLPKGVFTKDKEGTAQPVRTENTRYLWGDGPNPEDTSMTFWERVIGDEVFGDGFVFIEKDADGLDPAALWHVDRNRVRVGRTSRGRRVYEIDGDIPMIDYSAGGDIGMIPNWGKGMRGWDIVKGARDALSLGISAQEYASQAIRDGGIPPGIISVDGLMDDAQADKVEARWNKARAAGRRQFRVAVLSNAKFMQLSQQPESLQLLGMRRYQAGEQATLLATPPHMVGLVDAATSWGSGIAQQTAGFSVFTLARHTTRVEQFVNKFLLVHELTGRYFKNDFGGLLRGTTLERYQAYALGYGRWLSTNNIRADEDLPPVPGGDEVLAAVNMAPLEEIAAVMALTETPAPASQPPAQPPKSNE